MSEELDPLSKYIARAIAKEIAKDVIKILNESLELQKELLKQEARTGEIKQRKLMKDLSISSDTLKKWENNGLKRIQRGGGAFYLLEDLHKFNY